MKKTHSWLYLLALAPLALQAGQYNEIKEGEIDFTTPPKIESNKIVAATPSQNNGAMSPAKPPQAPPQKNRNDANLQPTNAGVFANVEFLWWKLDEAGLDYLNHNKNGTAGDAQSNLIVGTIHSVDPKWHPGVRAGLGYRFSKELWELSANYTYYHTTGSDSIDCLECETNQQINPYLGVTTSPTALDALIAGKAGLSLYYNIGDIELAKPVSLGKYTSMRFVIGPSMAFIKQHLDNLYTDNTATFTECPPETNHLHTKWHFSGGGIKLGVDSRWNVLDRFNFLFGGYFSALHGYYRNTWKSNSLLAPIDLNVCAVNGEGENTPLRNHPLADTSFTNRRTILGMRIFGGLGYNYAFNKCSLELYVNYELNTWFNLTDQHRSTAGLGNLPKPLIFIQPTLNLSGIDVGLKLNF